MVPGSLCGLSLQGNMGRGLLGGLCTLTLPLASLGLQSSPLLGLDLDQAQAPLIPSFPSDHLWAFLRENHSPPPGWDISLHNPAPDVPSPGICWAAFSVKIVNAKVF